MVPRAKDSGQQWNREPLPGNRLGPSQEIFFASLVGGPDTVWPAGFQNYYGSLIMMCFPFLPLFNGVTIVVLLFPTHHPMLGM